MAVYWDTSCVLKLYCPESESDSETYLGKLESAAAPPLSSVLLATELHFAFQQKFRRNETAGRKPEQLIRRFQTDVGKGRFQLIPLDDDIHREARRICRLCYERPDPIGLRTLDGLHLATATLASCREVVTTDERMSLAMPLLGLQAG